MINNNFTMDLGYILSEVVKSESPDLHLTV